MFSILSTLCVVVWFHRSIWSGMFLWTSVSFFLCPVPILHPHTLLSCLSSFAVTSMWLFPGPWAQNQLNLLQRDWERAALVGDPIRDPRVPAGSVLCLPQWGPRPSRFSSASLGWWSLVGLMLISPHEVGPLLVLPVGPACERDRGSQLPCNPWASLHQPLVFHQCFQVLETLLFYLKPLELFIFSPYVIHIVMHWIAGRFLPKGQGMFLKVTGKPPL